MRDDSMYRLWQKNKSQWCHRPPSTHWLLWIHKRVHGYTRQREQIVREPLTNTGQITMTKTATLLEGARRGGRPCPSPLNECKRMRAQKRSHLMCLRMWECVCVCVHIPAKSPQPPLAQFRESSYLFCSVLQRITRKHNVRRVSHQPSVNFWGTETEGRVIKKGLAVDLVVDFIWKSNAATAFGRVDPSLRARGQIGRTYLRQKGHVSFFPNLPRQHLHASYLSRVFLKSPTSEESDFENFGVKTSPVSHNVPRQLA